MEYIHLTPQTKLPAISALAPYKAVVIGEDELSSARREAVSNWLVRSGCRYMMAWGVDCGGWETSVDANCRRAFKEIEVPDDRVVITTAHADEPLAKVFWFSKHTAMHPCFTLENVLLLHLASMGRERELCAQYAAA